MQRDTRQRRAIREAIQRHDRPLLPQEVLDSASQAVPGLGMATVYRTLNSGVEEGWLQPVEMPKQPTRYEPAGKGHHHHFHCEACERVFEIEGCPGRLQSLVPEGFDMTGHEVTLYGRCRDCRREEKAT